MILKQNNTYRKLQDLYFIWL